MKLKYFLFVIVFSLFSSVVGNLYLNIKINELYDSTRSWWRLSKTRSQKAMYGIGIAFGIIRSIYKINSWENGKKHNRPTRIRFHGEKAVDMQKHIGDSMLNQPNHRVSGPTFYINC